MLGLREVFLPLLATAAITPTLEPNMNGDYFLASTPEARKKPTWSTSFKDYPGGAESFTLYAGPITGHFGQAIENHDTWILALQSKAGFTAPGIVVKSSTTNVS